MPRYAVIEKKLGETPLHAMTCWRLEHDIPDTTPLSYAGRLDPMATGKLLVLIGEECKQQKSYTDLDKEYEIEVLLGMGSDSGDILGKVHRTALPNVTDEQIAATITGLVGTTSQPYPVFSSKTVAGKPLFLHALEGTLSSISIPVHDETIHRIALLKRREVSTPSLMKYVQERIALIPHDADPRKTLGADFRREDVLASWNTALAGCTDPFPVLRLRVTAASGTYMRTLASRIGEALGSTGLACAIHRTRIGRYFSCGTFGFWYKRF